MAELSHIRTSQVINTYGVGSLVPLESGGSAIVVGLDRWRGQGSQDSIWLHERRLKSLCKVDQFLSPPAGNSDGRDIPVVRFPVMVSCPQCRTLQPHKNFCEVYDNECSQCMKSLVPSRFVVACTRGHLDDFPYDDWIHDGNRTPGARHDLKLTSVGKFGALKDIEIRCSCDSWRSMDGAFRPRSLEGVFTCRGRRPWLPDAPDEECSQVPVVLQRGASNVWFPVTKSALCIPPWSESVFQVIEKDWGVIKNIPENALEAVLPAFIRDKPVTIDEVVTVVRARLKEESVPDIVHTEKSIRVEEFRALTTVHEESDRMDQFVCVPPSDSSLEFIDKWFEKVMEVKRLREIRALESFTRVTDTADTKRKPSLAHLSYQRQNWLPAIEVIGEGVFLQLRETEVTEWEMRSAVLARANSIISNADADREVPITPRMILVHSLAHAIIDQWSLECGYPASDLRERLYVGEGMAGVLIYTSSSDSTGSLGGVVAQAEPEKLEISIPQALEKASWCSSDPYCIETSGGFNSLNIGACHACLLLPEPSCEEMNSYLDRGLLVKGYGTSETGYFPATQIGGF